MVHFEEPLDFERQAHALPPSLREPQLLHHLFMRAARLLPEHVALEIPDLEGEVGDRRWTYQQLDRRSTQLAARIQAWVPGECVLALLIPRRTHLHYVAQLAALKAGAAYVCLDPLLPAERLQFVLDDSEAVGLLYIPETADLLETGLKPETGNVLDLVSWERSLEHEQQDTQQRKSTEADTDSEEGKTSEPEDAQEDTETAHAVAQGSDDTESKDAQESGTTEQTDAQESVGTDPKDAQESDDTDPKDAQESVGTEQEDEIEATRLSYVIYTSGTTGKPKGVMIEHRSVVNLMRVNLDYFGLCPADRVGQGASSAYDASVEEIYLAFAAGATLVVMDDDVMRLGPDLVPWLQRTGVTVLGPAPTLLRMTLCEDPQEALPALRLLYVGGEALPHDLAERWSRGRWMENGYGPTECTVTVVRGRVAPGEPITIGVPVEGNEAYVLDEALEDVPDGEQGELCIGGIGVARGYLRRPALTAQKFIMHPKYGRLYRTGDLVTKLPSGEVDYLGRIDTQVKIRGYRVELEAIESHLCGQSGIAAAACKVQGSGVTQQLVAFVVPREGHTPDFDALREALSQALPSYMVPAHFGTLAALPQTASSGKTDRKALPDIAHEFRRTTDFVPAQGPLEEHLAHVFAMHLGLPEALSVTDDFFELGGNSVLAAQVISTLRKDETTASLTVRALYEAPTVRKLAAHLAAQSPDEGPTRQAAPRALGWPIVVSLFQFGLITSGVFGGAAVVYFLSFYLFPWLLRLVGVLPFVLLLPLLGYFLIFLFAPFGLVTAVVAKRILIGDYRPGRHPVWGWMYLRNWLMQRFVQAIPWGLVEGTELKNVCLRALGAKIGKNVHIHTGVNITAGGWDLLEIGDNVTIGRDAALRLVDYEHQKLRIGPISIEDDCTLDTRAGMCPHSHMEHGAFLTALSMLPSHTTCPAGERWEGVPAAKVGAAPAQPDCPQGPWHPMLHAFSLIGARWLFGAIFAIPFQLLTVACILYWDLDAEKILAWLFSPYEYGTTPLLVLLALLMLGILLSLPWQAFAIRSLGPIAPGVYPQRGWHSIRIWLKQQSLESVGNLLSGTMFWPSWLRMAGMRVGPKCEISTIMEVLPELIEIGRESFFADGIYLGRPLLHQGTITCAQTTLGFNSFLGNHAILPAGTELAEGTLLGICTVAQPRMKQPGSSWFGHPAFALPRREIVECERTLTHDPGWLRYFNRFFWESLRFFLPILPMAVGLLWFKTIPYWAPHQSHTLFFLVTLPLYATTIAFLFCAIVFALKWGLLGQVKPGQHPLWSCWCSRWDFLYVAWGAYARPILSPFEETLWLAWWLRAMGVTIGKRVVLGGGFAQVVDPDMLHFEDHATVVNMFQAHSFEDRVLKVGHVWIGPHATAGAAAVLLYGASIGAHTHLGEHSVVMKHESLLPYRYYVGAPSHTAPPPQGTETL